MIRSAFTLIETTIALAIVCLLVAISTWNLSGYQAKVAEKQSLLWFQNTFKSAINYAYLNNRVAGLIISRNNNQIIFNYDRKNAKNAPIKKLTLPKTLKIIYKDTDDYSINKFGDNQSFKIRFQSKIDHKIYDFKVLTGWGEIIAQQT